MFPRSCRASSRASGRLGEWGTGTRARSQCDLGSGTALTNRRPMTQPDGRNGARNRRNRHRQSNEAADALIIGAGASGAIAAKYLARAGLDVVCLDQGSWVQSSKFPTAHRAWELIAETRWNLNPNQRALP